MKRYKSIIIAVVIILMVLLFSFNAETVTYSVKYSLQLCYNSVIPSLFPFFILCEFLMLTVGGILKNAPLTAFLTGLITGFPTGVKNVCTLYENGDIDRNTATALLHCTANASPAYIVSFIGGCIMSDRTVGIILLISQLVCAFSCGLFFGCFKKRNLVHQRNGVISITDAACKSIANSVISCLYVCGYIIFFGLIADILVNIGFPNIIAKVLFFLPSESVKAVIVGFIEITRGIMMPGSKSIAVAAVITAFSGVSVIMQCVSCTVKSGLSARPILTGKLAYSLLMPLIASCLQKLMPTTLAAKHNEPSPFISFLLFLLFISFCIIFIYNIFDKSSKKIYNDKNTLIR